MARGMTKGLLSGTGKSINGAVEKTVTYGEGISSKNVAILISTSSVKERPITIDSSKIGSVLTNYPVRVELNSSNFDFSSVRNDGNDIRFLDGLDNLLFFEKTFFDKTNQKAVFDVNIPSVSSSLDTVFSMVYGDDSSEDQSNANQTWNSNYEAVLHLGESLIDSTGKGNNGTNVGTTIVDGLSGKARHFNGSSRITLNDATLTDNTGGVHDTTIQAIINQDSMSGNQSIITYRGSSDTLQANLAILNATGFNNYLFYDTFPPGGGHVSFNQTIPINQFNLTQSVISQGTDTAKMDVNNLTTTLPYTETYSGAKPTSIDIGALNSPPLDNFFRGSISDLRISSAMLSDEWRSADRYNLLEKTLITVGSETSGGGASESIFATTDISRLQEASELVVTIDAKSQDQDGQVLSILR